MAPVSGFVALLAAFSLLLGGCVQYEIVRQADWDTDFRGLSFPDIDHGWIVGADAAFFPYSCPWANPFLSRTTNYLRAHPPGRPSLVRDSFGRIR